MVGVTSPRPAWKSLRRITVAKKKAAKKVAKKAPAKKAPAKKVAKKKVAKKTAKCSCTCK
jgi:hypothetical protein